ncbi:MAG: hypothetical protein AABX16_05385 [Nanoarchaeota archaeon]
MKRGGVVSLLLCIGIILVIIILAVFIFYLKTPVTDEVKTQEKKSYNDQLTVYDLNETEERFLLEVLTSGAILNRINATDVPAYYISNTNPLDYALYPTSEVVRVSRNGSIRYEYHFAKLDVQECYKIKDTKSFNDDGVFAECIIELAKIVGDPTICREMKNAPENNDVGYCALWFGYARNDISACFEIERPVDLNTDGYYEFDYSENPDVEHLDYESFTACVLETIMEKPTEEGCVLLENTLEVNLPDLCARFLSPYKEYFESYDIDVNKRECELIASDPEKAIEQNPLLSAYGYGAFYFEACEPYLLYQNYETLCKKIETIKIDTNSILSDQCYVVLAEETGDETWCDAIRLIPSKNDCLLTLSIVKEDISYCKKIVNPWKDHEEFCFDYRGL